MVFRWGRSHQWNENSKERSWLGYKWEETSLEMADFFSNQRMYSILPEQTHTHTKTFHTTQMNFACFLFPCTCFQGTRAEIVSENVHFNAAKANVAPSKTTKTWFCSSWWELFFGGGRVFFCCVVAKLYNPKEMHTQKLMERETKPRSPEQSSRTFFLESSDSEWCGDQTADFLVCDCARYVWVFVSQPI